MWWLLVAPCTNGNPENCICWYSLRNVYSFVDRILPFSGMPGNIMFQSNACNVPWQNHRKLGIAFPNNKNNDYIYITDFRNYTMHVFATPPISFEDFWIVFRLIPAIKLLESCSELSFIGTFRVRYPTSAWKAAKIHIPICFGPFWAPPIVIVALSKPVLHYCSPVSSSYDYRILPWKTPYEYLHGFRDFRARGWF